MASLLKEKLVSAYMNVKQDLGRRHDIPAAIDRNKEIAAQE